MDDMQAFEDRTNKARAAVGKPPALTYGMAHPARTAIGSLFADARWYDAKAHSAAATAEKCLQWITARVQA